MSQSATRAQVTHGLEAIYSGVKVGVECSAKTAAIVHDPEIKSFMEGSIKYSLELGERAEKFMSEFGAQKTHINKIIKCQYDVCLEMREKAPDERGQDYSAIEVMRLALHYYKPIFSSVLVYAEKLRHDALIEEMRTSIETVDKADEMALELLRKK